MAAKLYLFTLLLGIEAVPLHADTTWLGNIGLRYVDDTDAVCRVIMGKDAPLYAIAGCAYFDETGCVIVTRAPAGFDGFVNREILGVIGEELWHCKGATHE